MDGNTGDWNFTKDFYAQMYRAGNPDKPVESWLYLRYDCPTNTLYILVRGRPKVPILIDPAKTAWVAVDVISNKVVNGYAGNDGVPPDFAWVDIAPAPGDTVAAGYEASVTLMPGTYRLIVHADVYDDDETQTSAVTGFPKDGLPLVLDCTVPVDESSWGRIKTLYR